MLKKKGISTVISFVLLTGIVFLAAVTSYTISLNILNNKIEKLDRDKMYTYLKELSQATDEISNFDDSTTSRSLNFKKGSLLLNGNQIIYQSLVKFNSAQTRCFEEICYIGEGGYERLYINLSPPFSFKNNITLVPGYYRIIFTNIKNESKIKVKFR